MSPKQDSLHRIIKATYLSAHKFLSTLKRIPASELPDKLEALVIYLKKKAGECKELERLIQMDAQKEEEAAHNEMEVQMVDFLGRKGLIRTARNILTELCITDLIPLEPYKDAKLSIEQIRGASTPKISHASSAQVLVLDAAVTRRYIMLCKSGRREEAVDYYMQHESLVDKELLSLLILPPDSFLFSKISSAYSDVLLFPQLQDRIVRDALGGTECMFYHRVSLGVAGFSTLACREEEEAKCPGCNPKKANLAKYMPKTMRSASRILCSYTKASIPADAPIYCTESGQIVSEPCITTFVSDKARLGKLAPTQHVDHPHRDTGVGEKEPKGKPGKMGKLRRCYFA